jgi:hypothetical protein
MLANPSEQKSCQMLQVLGPWGAELGLGSEASAKPVWPTSLLGHSFCDPMAAAQEQPPGR